MILHYFIKKESIDKKNSDKIYLSMVNFTQLIISKKTFKIKRNFNSSFELMTILLFTFFFIYRNTKKNRKINQYLMDLYIIDIDKTLRELGIGDMSIGKYVKTYVNKIYYRIPKLEKTLKSNNYLDFEKYIINKNIVDQIDKNKILSKFLFKFINKSLKKAKKEDFSNFVFFD